jgi:hypothetical protein
MFAKKKELRTELYLKESPSVISMMSTVVSPGGSIDSAVRYVADKGPKNSAKLFRDIVSDTDSRKVSDIRDCVYDLASSMPKGLASFRRSLYIVISASETSDPAERSRMLKEATDIALGGLRETGEEYSSKLQTPCMVVFGLGIMVPMILLSIAPMLGMGDVIGMAMTIPESLLEEVILVIVPAAVAAVIVSLRGRNPLREDSVSLKGLWKASPMLLAVPVYSMLSGYGIEGTRALALAIGVPALFTYLLIQPDVRKETVRTKVESVLKDALFDLGNRMVTGENFESALVNSLSVRKECRTMAESLSREYVICRGDLESAIDRCISPVSVMMAGFVKDIYRASCKDIRDAGRLAIAIAHQLKDQDSVRKNLDNKLRSMTDMMSGTAAVFAPLILGLSIMMMGPLAAVSGSADTTHTFAIVCIYLTELAILMSAFGSMLSGKLSAENVIHRVSMTLPVAMAILVTCASISI